MRIGTVPEWAIRRSSTERPRLVTTRFVRPQGGPTARYRMGGLVEVETVAEFAMPPGSDRGGRGGGRWEERTDSAARRWM